MARKGESEPKKKIAWVSVFGYLFRFTIGAVVVVGAVYGLHRTETFLVRDARFRFVGPEYGFESPSLQVQGVRYTSRTAVLRVFSPDFGRSVYLLPLKQRRAELKALDWVKDASISRIWPNKVLVKVEERQPVAFVQVPVDRFSRVAMIDGEGKILQQPAQAAFHLPVLAGLKPDDTEPVRREYIGRLLYALKEMSNSADRISELDVRNRHDLVITAKMDRRAVTLMMGDRNFGSRVSNFISHYPEIQRRMPGAWKFDLRLDDRITAVEEKE